MKNEIAVFILTIIAVLILILSDFGRGQTVVYDCRDAHWHPDVPVDVKKECARMFYEEWKKKENERKNEERLHESSSSLLRT